MKGLIHKIEVPIYGLTLKVTFCFECYQKELGYETRETEGSTFRKGGVITLFLKSKDGGVSLNTVAHESFHVADYIGEAVGLEFQPDGANEQYAYLIGWVTDKVFDCLSLENKWKETSTIN